MTTSVLGTYLSAYRKLIVTESLDENNVTISFPFHLAGSHRIEITVTTISKERCILSDAGRTLGEIEDAGHSLTPQIKERLEKLANLSGVRIVRDHLLLESTYKHLGVSIQKYLEMSKMIGDVYLVHRQRADAGDDLLSQVRNVFDSTRILYRQRQKLHGQIEDHQIDLLVAPNGHPGLALNVVSGQNTHALAQIWYGKCDDIRRAEENNNIKIALIYDVRFDQWSSKSKAWLAAKADVILPGDGLNELPERIATQGVINTAKPRRPRV
jgi:hypothetical protein